MLELLRLELHWLWGRLPQLRGLLHRPLWAFAADMTYLAALVARSRLSHSWLLRSSAHGAFAADVSWLAASIACTWLSKLAPAGGALLHGGHRAVAAEMAGLPAGVAGELRCEGAGLTSVWLGSVQRALPAEIRRASRREKA